MSAHGKIKKSVETIFTIGFKERLVYDTVFTNRINHLYCYCLVLVSHWS